MINPIPEKCLSVVMPVYNEENTICTIVESVLARPETGELLIVDDASKDASWEKLQKFASDPRVKLLQQKVNCGKGAALQKGFAAATLDYVVIQDADFEYTPEDYPILLQPLVDGKAEVVYGARFMNAPGQVRFFRHEMGNKFLTFWSNVFSDIHLSDMETCYKCFRREVLQNLILTSCRFGIEVEMTAKLARSRKLRIWEVPISYRPRGYNEGKKIGWKDGFAALWHIIRFNCFTKDESCFAKPWESVLPSLTKQ